MTHHPIEIYLETSDKKVFACAQQWPGWCRSGKDEGRALDALTEAAPRYAAVVELTGDAFPDVDGATSFEVVERIPGGAGTAFGVPGAASTADGAPVDAVEARR